MSTQLATREGLRLCEILSDAQFIGAQDILVRSCCGQWDDCQPNDVFVAIIGPDTDGHEFAHEAVERGAVAVVTERLLSIDYPQCIVRDSREAYGKICQALAGTPSDHLVTIGVGGSAGKTTTSHLIRSILAQAKTRVGLSSSIEVDMGQGFQSVPPTQINSPTLAEQLSQMVMAGCGSAVVELSSKSLAQRSLEGIQLDVSVITNIRHDHLDFHGSTKNYRRSQLRILSHLKPDGMAVLNADDPESHFLLDQLECPVLTFGIKQDAHVTAELIERSPSEQTFMIHAGCESVLVRTGIIGKQHIYNCLAATTVALSVGVELSVIAKGLESVGTLPGRLERIECGQDFGVWVDSARSPYQLATMLRAVKDSIQGKLWCVCTTNEGQAQLERRHLGEVVERTANQVVLTQSEIDGFADYEPAHQVLDGFSRPESVRLIPNRFQAIEWVLQQAQPGDAVVITGCGEKPFALVGEERWAISDRDVCQAWLYDNASLRPQEKPTESGPEIFDIEDYR